MEESMPSICIACREIIEEGATICPHCGTSQRPQIWNIFSKFLKWVGGITAVITVVSGSIQLNSLFNDWQEKQRVVDNYVTAAKFQYETGGIEIARELLRKATELDPTSDSLLNFQVDLVMTKLREYYSSNRRAPWVLTYKFYKDGEERENYDWTNLTSKREYIQKVFIEHNTGEWLALGLVGASGPRKAEILAHIAWYDLLVDRKREDHYIKDLFEKALKADPHNVFARIMYSGWLMEYYKLQEDPEAHFSKALQHLGHAKPGNDERAWFTALMFKLLSLADDLPQSEIEMLRLIAKLEPRDITPSAAADSLDKLASYAPKYDDEGNVHDNPKRELLNTVFSDNEFIALAERLGKRAFGCDPFDLLCDPGINVRIGFNLFDTLAFLYEESGQYSMASESFSLAWLARRRANYDADEGLLASMKRTMTASGIPAREVTTVVEIRKGQFRKGDVVTKLNGVGVHSVDDMREIYRNVEKGQPFTVTVVRGGVTQKFNLNYRPSQFARFTDYVVPIDFLTGKKTQGHFSRMHIAWSSK